MSESGLLIRGGTVVDGTGGPAFRSDVRVRDGRITEVGPDLAPDGESEIDATGAVVTPGFIDSHAHTDPQVFWDPSLDPEPLHGVTTMLVGNCSLSLFPVTEASRGAVSDLFAYIEDVPRHLFDDSIPWTWSNYDGYRDAVNATGTGINLASLVGHSPLRLAVMGEDAWTRVATAQERSAMVELFRAAMDAGAWGLSTSRFDVDKNGRPVPSRAADGDEFDALLDVIQEAGRGLVEFIPDLLGDDAVPTFRDLARRCGERDIPLTWTGFVQTGQGGHTEGWLQFTRDLAAEGCATYPQLSPRTVDFRLNWESSMMFMTMQRGWNQVIVAEGDEKAAILRDPDWRATAREEWDRTDRSMFPVRRPESVRFVEVFGEQNEQWLGRTLADLVEEKRGHPSDVFADFVLANDCHPGVVAVGIANSDVEAMGRTLADPSVIVSSSDAGAHMQMLCASGDATLLLTRHVRERGDLTLEQAVHALTGRQADIFGFTGRGRVAEGMVADLAVFALDELHYDSDSFVNDLPKDGARLRRPEGGFRATVVGGVPVQLEGKLTGSLPGRVISSAE